MELLSTQQATDRLGLSTRPLRRLVDDGKIAVYRIGPRGGLVRFSPDDRDDYLRSTRQFGPQPPPSAKPPRRRA